MNAMESEKQRETNDEMPEKRTKLGAFRIKEKVNVQKLECHYKVKKMRELI